MPFLVDCECKQGASEGDVVFEMENQIIAIIIAAIRWVCLLALYGGFSAVIYSVFVIEHPTDVSLTPPISPAMSCVMNLTVQYFTIYLLLWICITAQQFLGDAPIWDQAIAIFDAGRATVMFAPMLSMLFIGTRMRALQLTKASDGTIPVTAGPQPWAQDCMFMCTWAVLIQVLMVMVMGCMYEVSMDEDGNMKAPENASKIVGWLVTFLRYACMIAMYGGVGVLIYAVFDMTPETLPPYGNENLVPMVESGTCRNHPLPRLPLSKM